MPGYYSFDFPFLSGDVGGVPPLSCPHDKIANDNSSIYHPDALAHPGTLDFMPSDASHPVATLYGDHHDWLYKWLCRRMGDRFDAQDVAHDTFMRVLARRGGIILAEPRSYLTTIAHGLMVDRFRRRAIEQAYLDALAVYPEPETISQEAHAILVETLLEIDRLLCRLGARTRDIFLLAQIEGLSQVEIARHLRLSLPTVKKHLVRAYTECLVLAAG